jgi:hypothetical protein
MTVASDFDDLDGLQYTPFNDTNLPRIQRAAVSAAVTRDGMDTRAGDSYRQGVSIKTARHQFATTQPKMWSGNRSHFVRLVTYGQPRSFTEFENSSLFEEQPKFDPVWFLTDPNYPRPIVFNQGPAQQEEAIIEPLVIAMRLKTNEGPIYSHDVRAGFMGGNDLESLRGSTEFVEQFVEFNEPSAARFWLDEGDRYVGTGALVDRIIVPGFSAKLHREIDPFDDSAVESLVAGLSSKSVAMRTALHELDYDLSEDVRGSFERRSSPAGGDVYGPTQALYGTDSIAYRGWTRGA